LQLKLAWAELAKDAAEKQAFSAAEKAAKATEKAADAAHAAAATAAAAASTATIAAATEAEARPPPLAPPSLAPPPQLASPLPLAPSLAERLHEDGYVIMRGAGLSEDVRARAHRVRGYAKLFGVALQPEQKGCVLRKVARLDDVAKQQHDAAGRPLSEQQRGEALQLHGELCEAAARALQEVQLDGQPVFAPALLVALAGASQQGWHTDADADQTFSLLFPVDHRQFCVHGCDEPLELEPGDVLVFTGWLCHAGAERLEDAGESLCLHAYAGDGITPKILQNVFSCLHL
jgi:hypothetical protein